MVFGGGTKAQVDRISVYAQQMGIAFQIGDDLLDLVGEPRVLGKPVGNSLVQGRPMLPLIYLWSVSSEATRTKLSRLDEHEWPRHDLVTLLEQRGILDRVRDVQQRHVDAAIGALEGFPHAGASKRCAPWQRAQPRRPSASRHPRPSRVRTPTTVTESIEPRRRQRPSPGERAAAARSPAEDARSGPYSNRSPNRARSCFNDGRLIVNHDSPARPRQLHCQRERLGLLQHLRSRLVCDR